MSEFTIYEQLWKNAAPAIAEGNNGVDKFLAYPKTDARRGITLIARIPSPIASNINECIGEFDSIENGHYCQPKSDLHLTLMSIVTCTDGYLFSPSDKTAYINLVSHALTGCKPLNIHYSGVTATKDCIMIAGFDLNNALRQLRANLRACFANSELAHSIDSRYTLQTAHSTVLRFTKPILKPNEVVNWIEQNRKREFGKCILDKLELVVNDWYQTRKNTVILNTFPLNSPLKN